ncbi:cisplatin damage response ATP-dependent DNA ligase [Alteromonas sp. ASW11-130]|uniref:cisplatin damage response ATP-dependent DNA ligase n=1 Tax=Alteromonas sp. ASW11-130 TaxID=3015775 RepID=UPI002242BDC6|nr:cisplatin damage response ATP-dependent DNA ligase [Alteromonas sp. ASW11-130]MCW8090753.1 cisplatin damage response ATP-dependent DNA ligase [Alteromonas sp. ASW11-130]
MQAFSELLEQLYYTSSHNAKAALIIDYLKRTPDPDRGWAIAAIAGSLRFEFFKRNTVKQLILERVDSTLFDLSYDYVGEMSETVAHLWPEQSATEVPLPTLGELVEKFSRATRKTVPELLAHYLSSMNSAQRWALIKLGTSGLRVGVSARSIKQILARYGNKSVEDIERLWHGVEPPYTDLLGWLEGKADMPDISDQITFSPVMLSHPLTLNEVLPWDNSKWQVEHKYDGIRVQLVVKRDEKALFSRNADDISHSFPDLLEEVSADAVIDGELLVMHGSDVAPFNDLQQRLNKKKPNKILMQTHPAGLIAYDILSLNGQSLVDKPLSERRQYLIDWVDKQHSARIQISETLETPSEAALKSLHELASENLAVEGLMLKRIDSAYVPGRPKGQWYKWKRDPKIVDAVMMYAQRGHGKRSSYYSDFTFGAWQGDQLLPIGKAYSGFTDEELKKLDNWVRRNSIGRFGPVREVKKELVVEVAFDAVHPSTRHKSGVAMRFPRINRIRWDKPAREADTLETVVDLIEPKEKE